MIHVLQQDMGINFPGHRTLSGGEDGPACNDMANSLSRGTQKAQVTQKRKELKKRKGTQRMQGTQKAVFLSRGVERRG
jgi:hypothetical protein